MIFVKHTLTQQSHGFISRSVLMFMVMAAPLVALAQPAKESIRLANTNAVFQPIPGKYVLFLAPGGQSANARSSAAKVSGLKVLATLASPNALVVTMPAAAAVTNRKSAQTATTMGGQALRPVYTYSDGTEEAPTGTVAVRFKSIALKKGLAQLAEIVGATYRTSELDATLAYLDLPAESNPFEVARQLSKHANLVWAEPDMLKFLKRSGAKSGTNTASAASLKPAPMAPMAPQITLPNDPLMKNQWHLHNGGRSTDNSFWNNSDVKAFEAWETTQGSATIKVAVIDEGVDLAHPDLAGQLLPGFDATGLGSGGAPSGNDAHGTACSGIIAAKAGNSLGATGVAPNCKIIPIRIAYSDANGNWVTTNANIGSAIQWAWKTGQADVLSNSWGGGSSSSLITNPIDSAILKGRGGKGAPVIFAAGNSNTTTASFPAIYSKVISVIAMSMCDTRKTPTSCDGETWWGSNYGQNGDVSAPGVIMTTLDISGTSGYSTGDYVANFNGTSSACPTVAGVMALMLSSNPALTADQARALLETTCDKVGAYSYAAGVSGQPNGSWSSDLGYGRVNALRVVNTAANARFSTIMQLNCNTTITGTTSGASFFNAYTCNPVGTYTGSEAAYSLFASKGAVIKLRMTPSAGEADLFLLKRFHKDSCIAASIQTGLLKDSIVYTAPYTGYYYVLVDGASTASFSLQTVCTVPPTITDFTPKVVNFGAVVTLTGTNFTPLTSLKLNGVVVAGATVNAGGTSITFTVPNNGTSGLINVLTPGGTANTASSLFITGQACSAAVPLACGDSVTGNNSTGTNLISTYKCQTWSETGPEKMYTIQGQTGMTITAALSNMTGDLDVFLLSACHPDSCVASGDASLTATLKNKTYYLVVDGYSGGTSGFKLKLTCTSLINCRATSTCTSNYINSVTVNMLSNPSTGCAGTGGYINYAPTGALTTTLTKGTTYDYLVNFGATQQKSAIWVDFNNDGDFTDAKECIILSNTLGASLSGHFTVPVTATVGTVKMRVRSSGSTSMDTAGSCTNTTLGETEDYTITIVAPSPPAINITSISGTACLASDVQFFFSTTEIPAGTQYDLYTSTDGVTFTALAPASVTIFPSPDFTDSPGSFQTNFPMADNVDSIQIWVELHSSTGIISNRVSYWQFNRPILTGPASVERCGPGAMSLTLTVPESSTVDWYTEGNFVSSGSTLTIANQAVTAEYFAAVMNRFGCSSSFSTQFMVNSKPKVNNATPGAANIGETIRIHGLNLALVTGVKHGTLTASFVADGDSALNVTVPAGATANRIYITTAKGCTDSTAVMAIPPPISSSWPITFGNTSDDYVRGIVRDASGNVYASIAFTGSINLQGIVINAGTKRDALLAKFNDAGQLLWYSRIGNNTFNMEPRGVNVDGAGNPYWAGSFAGTVTFPNGAAGIPLVAAGSYDAYTARFDPATGNCIWAKRVGGPGSDYLYACFVSNSGNVYAGGSYTGPIVFQTGATSVNLPNAGGLDGFVVKFDPNGNGIYASRMGSTENDEVKSIEYNGGDLVACGYMGNNTTFPGTTGDIVLPTLNGSRDAWAARISSTGQYVWVKNFGTNLGDEAQSICLDPSTGNVFIAAQVADVPMAFNGTNYSGYGNNDIAVVGYNFYTQAPVWAKRIGSSTGDIPASIRWDGQRIVVAGYAGGSFSSATGFPLTSNGGQDAVLLRYDKTTGAITSGSFVGGSGSDQAQALYCNTATKESFVGGGFSGSVSFPSTTGSVVRVSNGTYDGFLYRAPAETSSTGKASVKINNSGGSGHLQFNALTAWPNPASDVLNVSSASDGPVFLAQANGTVHMRLVLVANQPGVFHIGNLSPGLYLLRQGNKTLRIVVQ